MLSLTIGLPPLLLLLTHFLTPPGTTSSAAVVSNFVFDDDDPVTHFRLIGPMLAEELYAIRRDQVDEAVANDPVAPVDPAPPAPRGYVPLPSARSSFIHPPPPINRSPHPHFSATPRRLASSPTFHPSSTSSSPTFDATPRNILDSPTFRDQLFPPIPSPDLQPASAPLVAATPPQPQPLPRRSDRLHPPSPAPPPRRSTCGPKPRDFLYLAFVSAFVADAFPTQVATHLPLFDPVIGITGPHPCFLPNRTWILTRFDSGLLWFSLQSQIQIQVRSQHSSVSQSNASPRLLRLQNSNERGDCGSGNAWSLVRCSTVCPRDQR